MLVRSTQFVLPPPPLALQWNILGESGVASFLLYTILYNYNHRHRQART